MENKDKKDICIRTFPGMHYISVHGLNPSQHNFGIYSSFVTQLLNYGSGILLETR